MFFLALELSAIQWFQFGAEIACTFES